MTEIDSKSIEKKYMKFIKSLKESKHQLIPDMKLLNLKNSDLEVIQLNQNHDRNTFIYESKIATPLDPIQGQIENSGIISVISALVKMDYDFNNVVS